MAIRKIAGICLVAIVLIGVGVSFGKGIITDQVRNGVLELFHMLGRGSGALLGRLEAIFDSPADRRINDLEAERVGLLGEIARREGLRLENEVLRQALELQSEGEEGVLPAVVIGFIREARAEFVLINKGRAHGVRQGDIVIDSRRVLAGVVSAVDKNAAHVELLSSPGRTTDVTVVSSGLRALVRGDNNRMLDVDLVPQEAELRRGDIIAAAPSATGGRRGVLIGEVVEVEPSVHEVFKVVRAIHLFDPKESDVLVLLGIEP